LEKGDCNVKKHVFVIVISGPLKGQSYFVISKTPLLIGRSEEANIRIDYDNFCSRKHALLFWENNRCVLKDLESTNGTFVNYERINKPTVIKEGDIISLGETKIIISVKDRIENGQTSGDEMISEN
jgi:pSer/pThr/pTyr-binding forkhead associated (FHA) protein